MPTNYFQVGFLVAVIACIICFYGIEDATGAAWKDGPVKLRVDTDVVHEGQSINISCATDKELPMYKIYMGSEDPILLDNSNGTETLNVNGSEIKVSYINITKTVNNCSDGVLNLTCEVVIEGSPPWSDHVDIPCSNSSSEVTDTPAPTDATSQPSNQGLSLGIIIVIVAIVILVGVPICVCLIKNKLPCRPLPSEQGAHEMEPITGDGAHDDTHEATPTAPNAD